MNATQNHSENPVTVADPADRVRRKQGEVLASIRKTGKDGRRLFARLPDDALTREAWDLGEAWRRSEEP